MVEESSSSHGQISSNGDDDIQAIFERTMRQVDTIADKIDTAKKRKYEAQPETKSSDEEKQIDIYSTQVRAFCLSSQQRVVLFGHLRESFDQIKMYTGVDMHRSGSQGDPWSFLCMVGEPLQVYWAEVLMRLILLSKKLPLISDDSQDAIMTDVHQAIMADVHQVFPRMSSLDIRRLALHRRLTQLVKHKSREDKFLADLERVPDEHKQDMEDKLAKQSSLSATLWAAIQSEGQQVIGSSSEPMDNPCVDTVAEDAGFFDMVLGLVEPSTADLLSALEKLSHGIVPVVAKDLRRQLLLPISVEDEDEHALEKDVDSFDDVAEQTIVLTILHFLEQQNGHLKEERFHEVYKVNPRIKFAIQRAGGIAKFCDKHASLKFHHGPPFWITRGTEKSDDSKLCPLSLRESGNNLLQETHAVKKVQAESSRRPRLDGSAEGSTPRSSKHWVSLKPWPKIYIAGLPSNVTFAKVERILKPYNPIEVSLPPDNVNPTRQAFAEFNSFTEAELAIENLDGKAIEGTHGEIMHVRLANFISNGQSQGTKARYSTKKAKLFIGGFHRDVTSEEIRKCCAQFGSVVEVNIYSKSSQHRCAFVSFKTFTEAELCIASMHGSITGEFLPVGRGRELKVSFADVIANAEKAERRRVNEDIEEDTELKIEGSRTSKTGDVVRQDDKRRAISTAHFPPPFPGTFPPPPSPLPEHESIQGAATVLSQGSNIRQPRIPAASFQHDEQLRKQVVESLVQKIEGSEPSVGDAMALMSFDHSTSETCGHDVSTADGELVSDIAGPSSCEYLTSQVQLDDPVDWEKYKSFHASIDKPSQASQVSRLRASMNKADLAEAVEAFLAHNQVDKKSSEKISISSSPHSATYHEAR
jgi:RNA recognition motif-containing protein